MRITVDKFISNPFTTEIPINITLEGQYVKILDKWGAVILYNDVYSARRSMIELLKEICSRKNVNYDVTFKLRSNAIDNCFMQILHELASKYSTTNIRVKIMLCHVDYKA